MCVCVCICVCVYMCVCVCVCVRERERERDDQLHLDSVALSRKIIHTPALRANVLHLNPFSTRTCRF